MGEVFNSIWDCKELIEGQLIDYIRTSVVHTGGITHLRRIASLADLYAVKTGCHGATDLSPVCMAAALHFNLSIPNFGLQEYMRHTPETDAVFPQAYTFSKGSLHPGSTAGLGVDIDEKLAAQYPYQRAYLPVNRLEDGTIDQLVARWRQGVTCWCQYVPPLSQRRSRLHRWQARLAPPPGPLRPRPLAVFGLPPRRRPFRPPRRPSLQPPRGPPPRPPATPRVQVPLATGWRFKRASGLSGVEAPQFDDSSWEQVTVPHTWNRIGNAGTERSPQSNNIRGTGWYRLNFRAPPAARGSRYFLQFDAVGTIADVWLNGHYLGKHEGAFARFRFDASAAIHPAGANLLVVAADNSRPAPGATTENVIPLSGDFFMFGGIYRSAALLVTQPVHLDLLDFGGPGVYGRAVEIQPARQRSR